MVYIIDYTHLLSYDIQTLEDLIIKLCLICHWQQELKTRWRQGQSSAFEIIRVDAYNYLNTVDQQYQSIERRRMWLHQIIDLCSNAESCHGEDVLSWRPSRTFRCRLSLKMQNHP